MPTVPFDGAWGHAWPIALAAYAAALALTLVLAARLTPRHWWRRPTLRGGAVLVFGTLVFGTLYLALAGRPQPALAALGTQPLAAPLPAATLPPALKKTPAPGARYRVAAELNLRSGSGVHAARVAVLPPGSRVIASGAVDGDWWQVRARVDGRLQSGWTSSLWLRRSDED
jgi:hypothetical protein